MRFRPYAVWGTALYVAVVTVVVVGLWARADMWWGATVVLFGPRWFLLLPLAVLVPVAAIGKRTMLVPLIVVVMVVIGPVMGFRWNVPHWFQSFDREAAIRIVTLNARGGRLTSTLQQLLADWDGDIALFQECGGAMGRSVRGLPDWHSEARDGLCIVSRFPIVGIDSMDRTDLLARGGNGLVQTYTLDVEGDLIFVTNVHLATPRPALVKLGRGQIRDAAVTLREISSVRAVELHRVRAWTDRFPGAQVVVGDFNTPVESVPFRSAWSDWKNAFQEAGFGFGATRIGPWIRVRIDHVLVSDGWAIQRARVGRDVGSDHVPLMVDLVLETDAR